METKKITDAKPTSKWMMVLSVVIFYIQYIVYLFTVKKMPTMDNVLVMFFISSIPVIAFTPVYLNIVVDKFTKKV